MDKTKNVEAHEEQNWGFRWTDSPDQPDPTIFPEDDE
jgi:hypothetical protein